MHPVWPRMAHDNPYINVLFQKQTAKAEQIFKCTEMPCMVILNMSKICLSFVICHR